MDGFDGSRAQRVERYEFPNAEPEYDRDCWRPAELLAFNAGRFVLLRPINNKLAAFGRERNLDAVVVAGSQWRAVVEHSGEWGERFNERHKHKWLPLTVHREHNHHIVAISPKRELSCADGRRYDFGGIGGNDRGKSERRLDSCLKSFSGFLLVQPVSRFQRLNLGRRDGYQRRGGDCGWFTGKITSRVECIFKQPIPDLQRVGLAGGKPIL